MIAICMTETICRSCGSEEPDVTKIGGFWNQCTKLAYKSYGGYSSDEKVHLDCRNAAFVLRN